MINKEPNKDEVFRVFQFSQKVKMLEAHTAFELLKSELAELGFSRVLYAFSESAYDSNSTSNKIEKSVILHSYRPDHVGLYQQENYLPNCAVVKYTNANTRAGRLKPLREINMKNQKFGHRLLTDVQEILNSEKINDGVIVPMKAAISSARGGMSAIVDGNLSVEDEQKVIAEKGALVTHYLIEFHRALEHRTLLDPSMYVTKREREILLWLSEGLQIKQLAHVLGIAESTVEKQLISARRRMNCPTTPSLLFKCLEYGLLE